MKDTNTNTKNYNNTIGEKTMTTNTNLSKSDIEMLEDIDIIISMKNRPAETLQPTDIRYSRYYKYLHRFQGRLEKAIERYKYNCNLMKLEYYVSRLSYLKDKAGTKLYRLSSLFSEYGFRANPRMRSQGSSDRSRW